MHKYSEAFTHGGQAALHKLHMMRQVMGRTCLWAILVSSVFLIGLLTFSYGWKNVWVYLCYFKAQWRVGLDFMPAGLFNTSYIYFENGSAGFISDLQLIHHPDFLKFISHLEQGLLLVIWQTFGIFMLTGLMVTGFWIYQGRRRERTEVVDGASVVEPAFLAQQIRARGASSIQIAGVPLPKNTECEHMMIVGATGAGKTNAINQLLEQIRALGHRAIIVDTRCGFVSQFFNPERDKILNPFDARTQHWNLWTECHESYDFDEFAESFIPLHAQEQPFWIKAAQQVLSSTAFKLKETGAPSIVALLNLLMSAPLEETAQFLKGSPVATYVDPAMEKTALSIRATLISSLRNLQYLEDDHDCFSLRDWIHTDTESQFLFLSSLTSQRNALKPLISAWLSIAIKALLERGPDRDRRIWFIIDELPALQHIPVLMNGLSEARAFGGCFVLGFQNLEQIHHLYGNHVARTMSSLLGTKLVFRVDDPYSTEHLSKVFGMQEILVPTKSISFGAHQVRDGVSLHHRDKLRPVIKPSDIAQLPNLSAYLKFPTDLPPTKLQFKYVSRSQITEPCIAKVSIQDQASLAESSTEALEPVLSAAPALRDVDTSRLDVPQPSVESRDAPIKPEPRLAYANIEMFEFTGTRQAIDEDSVE